MCYLVSACDGGGGDGVHWAGVGWEPVWGGGGENWTSRPRSQLAELWLTDVQPSSSRVSRHSVWSETETAPVSTGDGDKI